METALCITSLNDLIAALEENSPSEYPRILKNMDIPASDFESYKTWNPNDYTRNCIKRSQNFELLYLCWNKDQKTPIHSHDGQKCWVYQIEGSIEEIRFQKSKDGELIKTNTLEMHPGSLSYMHDSMGYHVLANITDGRACTLHIYVLPIENCEYYCDEDEVFKEKKLSYDTQ